MLPQRRKSAEEIAKLRESMGIPGGAPAPPPADEAAAPAVEAAEEEAPPAPVIPKAPRSLRKSEQQPVERLVAPPAETKSGLPVRRRSERELLEMRRIQATPPDRSIAHIQQLAAPWPLVFLGYLLPLAGALVGWFAAWSPGVPEPDFPADWLADLSREPWLPKVGFAALVACCVLGLAFAGWLWLKKPRSRHHAGFIVILAVLTAVFGLIHQFDPTHGP